MFSVCVGICANSDSSSVMLRAAGGTLHLAGRFVESAPQLRWHQAHGIPWSAGVLASICRFRSAAVTAAPAPSASKNHEQPPVICGDQSANNAPEHRSVRHYSPRRIGAGSYRDALRKGNALPRSVISAASARMISKTNNFGSGAKPKILMPSSRANKMPTA